MKLAERATIKMSITISVRKLIAEYWQYDLCKRFPEISYENLSYFKMVDVIEAIEEYNINKNSSTQNQTSMIQLMSSLFSIQQRNYSSSQTSVDSQDSELSVDMCISLIKILISHNPNFADSLEHISKKLRSEENESCFDDNVEELKKLVAQITATLPQPEIINIVEKHLESQNKVIHHACTEVLQKGQRTRIFDRQTLKKINKYMHLKSRINSNTPSQTILEKSSVCEDRRNDLSSPSTSIAVNKDESKQFKKSKQTLNDKSSQKNLRKNATRIHSSSEVETDLHDGNLNHKSSTPKNLNQNALDFSVASTSNEKKLLRTSRKLYYDDSEEDSTREESGHISSKNSTSTSSDESGTISFSQRFRETKRKVQSKNAFGKRSKKSPSTPSRRSQTETESSNSSHEGRLVINEDPVVSSSQDTVRSQKSYLCAICDKSCANLHCAGTCHESFHLICLGLTEAPIGTFKCGECLSASKSPKTQIKVPKLRQSLKPKHTIKHPQKSQRNKWSNEEIQKLIKGVNKYAVGSWSQIFEDCKFNKTLRTNVHLKDKWRTLLKQNLLKCKDGNWKLVE